MARKELACRNCRMITTDKVCPNCESTNLSQSWKGLVIINDVESEVAKELKISKVGIYALYVG